MHKKNFMFVAEWDINLIKLLNYDIEIKYKWVFVKMTLQRLSKIVESLV